MEPRPQPGGNNPPPKPWERAGTSSGPAPFKPPSAGSTSNVVEASGTAKPGEIVSTANGNSAVNTTALARPVPPRPWQPTYGNNSYGGYNSNPNYGSGYGSNMYGAGLGGTYGGGLGGTYGGGLGGTYGGGGLYGNSMYSGGYGGMYGGSGTYGGGMYNGGLGGPMGGYGMGGMGGPYGDQDPNNAPASPPSFWISFLRVMQGVVTFFGRISILIDQNTQAFHMFMSALLQLFDRSGVLYGELARFVLRVLGIRTKPRKGHPIGPNGLPGPHNGHGDQNYIEGPKAAPAGSWDNVWGNDAN